MGVLQELPENALSISPVETFYEEYGVCDLGCFKIMIDYHFQRKIRTDYNINHFATKGILENLYYKTLY